MIGLAVATGFTKVVAATSACAKGSFFGLVPWYQYLKMTPTCEVDSTKFKVLGGDSSLLLILMAIIDDLLRIAGMVAVGFVIYGGYKYIASQGSPDQTAEAQKTILNAVIGLVLAILAVAIVSFIGRRLG